jgi:hypothetical protein
VSSFTGAPNSSGLVTGTLNVRTDTWAADAGMAAASQHAQVSAAATAARRAAPWKPLAPTWRL